MQLTEIQLLESNYSQTDVHEIAAVAASTIGGTPVSALRWLNVDRVDAEENMREAFSRTMIREFGIERMSTMANDKDRPKVDKAEHLVVRDLDLKRLDGDDRSLPPGRIIAHGMWRYWASLDIPHKGVGEGEMISALPSTQPLGVNEGLQTLVDGRIESILGEVFNGLPIFGLLGISTLTPSHLRQGIAKRMTQWIVPYAERFALPVVLVASPLGLPLYRSCGGYMEYPWFDAIVDLTEWGGEGIHRHSMMIRWPEHTDRLPAEWKEWRDKHGGGVVG